MRHCQDNPKNSLPNRVYEKVYCLATGHMKEIRLVSRFHCVTGRRCVCRHPQRRGARRRFGLRHCVSRAVSRPATAPSAPTAARAKQVNASSSRCNRTATGRVFEGASLKRSRYSGTRLTRTVARLLAGRLGSRRRSRSFKQDQMPNKTSNKHLKHMTPDII